MMNPIFESSARRRMRTGRTPAILTAYLAVMAAFSFSQLTRFFGQGVAVNGMRQGIECYIWMTALQFLLIVVVAPALSAGSIAGERERQTFDLLLVTGVGVGRIVLGKLMESLAFLALMLLAGMPVLSLARITGGVTVLHLAQTYLYLLLIALVALSVGMLMSVLFRRTLSAVIASYLAIFAIGAGTWALALRGPLAAAYTRQTLEGLSQMSGLSLMALIPATLFLNPAAGLVTLLASQTGILHRTMEFTMRLNQIYAVFTEAGYGRVSAACFGAILLATAVLLALSVWLLHLQTGARGKGEGGRAGKKARRQG